MTDHDLPPRVVVLGPPGAGKSTIGRRLARALGESFHDTDAAIEEREGKSCGQVFSDLGEPEFRRIEEEVVAEALTTRCGVVSLGGGAVLSAATRALLARCLVVYLEISTAEGVRRTASSDSRPVLRAENPAAHYEALMRHRRPLYESVADIRVTTERRSPSRVIKEIVAAVEKAEGTRTDDRSVQ